MKVLVADNSRLVRERLVALLSELESIEFVGQAGDAGDMLGSVQELRPDVLILDVRMTGHHGLQVLEEIKVTAAGPVVIAPSAFPYPPYRRMCEQLGADFFLDKAAEIHRVAEVIGALGDR